MTTEELLHEVMHLRRVLDDIEGYEIDWAVGTGENMARVQNMARAALNRPIPSETAPAAPKEGTGGATAGEAKPACICPFPRLYCPMSCSNHACPACEGEKRRAAITGLKARP